MPSFWLTPYRDELLYSVVARLIGRLQYPSLRAGVTDVFGGKQHVAVVDLPPRLADLVSRFPESFALEPDAIIDSLTHFPFYAPFLPPLRAEELRLAMKGSGGGGIYTKIGLMASGVRGPAFFRICPKCVRNEMALFGEAYWHRLHQLSGVEICPEHEVFLENTGLPFINRRERTGYKELPASAARIEPRPACLDHRDDQILLRISRDARWVLDHPHQGLGLQVLHARYLGWLREAGLASSTGRIDMLSLQQDFERFFGDPLLAMLSSSLLGTEDNWLARLVRKPRTAQHPLHHLILMQFLGHKPADLYDSATQAETAFPFGKPPWPCLNQAASHCGNEVIRECTVTYDSRTRQPIGTFVCSCGFVYTRRGPDTSPSDRYTRTRVKAFGPVWLERLNSLAKDQNLGLREVARRLGADPHSVTSRLSKFSSPGNELAPQRGLSELLERHRSCWLGILQSKPGCATSDLRSLVPAIYTWLWRHDRKWLAANRPLTGAMRKARERVDWQARDAALSRAVKRAAESLLNAPGKPVRLTRTAISQAAGAKGLLEKHLDKLPKAATALAASEEDGTAYACRRITWVASEAARATQQLRRWELIRQAGIRKTMLLSPAVLDAIDVALGIQAHLG